jgi:hypothetical protein
LHPVFFVFVFYPPLTVTNYKHRLKAFQHNNMDQNLRTAYDYVFKKNPELKYKLNLIAAKEGVKFWELLEFVTNKFIAQHDKQANEIVSEELARDKDQLTQGYKIGYDYMIEQGMLNPSEKSFADFVLEMEEAPNKEETK